VLLECLKSILEFYLEIYLDIGLLILLAEGTLLIVNTLG
jgi:hypothetical protein